MGKKLVLLAVAFACLGALGVQPIAQAGQPQLQVGGDFQPGGTVTVSGSGCTDGQDGGSVLVQLLRLLENGEWLIDEIETVADSGGSWLVQMTIPADAIIGDTYAFAAECDVSSSELHFYYMGYTFVMGQPEPTTTTTTTGPTTTTSSDQASSTTTVRTVGQAVTASPRLTG
ncbi:MAG: hypothetical protein N2037_08410 [Acidimicrobiales bacterium]|nr:hypothetical protein [Acidimicrobiales bacterium]